MKEKELYINFDEYIKSLEGEYSQEELEEMKEMAHEEMRRGNVDWREYVTQGMMSIQILKGQKWEDRFDG